MLLPRKRGSSKLANDRNRATISGMRNRFEASITVFAPAVLSTVASPCGESRDDRECRRDRTGDAPGGSCDGGSPPSRAGEGDRRNHERNQQRKGEMELIHPHQSKAHAGERQTLGQRTNRDLRQGLEGPNEKDDRTGQHV